MIRIAHSARAEAFEAAAEIVEQLGASQPKVLLCFSSTRQNPRDLVRKLHEAYPQAAIVGGSTSGEIVSGRMLKDSVVAMALENDIVDRVATASIADLGPKLNLDAAFASLEKQIGSPLEELDPNHHVGIVIADGMSGGEERLIESIAERTELAFIGGSAGDDLKFQATQVFLNRAVLERSAVLLLMRVPRGFDIIKTQSFENTGTIVEATEVDTANRKILSLDHRPASHVYAEAVGTVPEALAESFQAYPLARVVGGEPFVRSPQRIEGTAIRFYCAVAKGEKLAVMKATDILSDTRDAIRKALTESPDAQGIVDFHCILRALELESKGLGQQYGNLFLEVPTVGFCTYGEAWTTHINQTSTMLVFR